ncbi:MAG: hypothetical protein CMJ49_00060 [Planctomycetaceae bacterium]|nr:hypothetical protein [Planctomycetaceae bacterium]
MNHSDIVTQSERADAAQWFTAAADALRAQSPPAPQARVECLRQSFADLVIGQSVIRQPLKLHGQTYDTGLGTAAESAIRITLPRPGRRLTGLAGVDDHDYARQFAPPLTFAVEINQREIWNSGPQPVDQPPAQFDIDLAAATEFFLTVNRPPMADAPANWVDLRVELDDRSTITIGQPPRQGPPVAFTLDQTPSSQCLHTWALDQQTESPTDHLTLHRITRTDPRTGLQLIVEFKQYTDFPVIEWIAHFKNTGDQNTPILCDIQSMDVRLTTATLGQNAILHHHTGDHRASDGYEPHQLTLTPGVSQSFAPVGGRPTNKAWPYYNIQCPDTNRGVIAVVAWPGQWASHFTADDAGLRITAGQQQTHLTLHPGERIRTPISVLLFYRGDHPRSQNLWRRWMMAHNMPRPARRLPQPFIAAASSAWFDEMTNAAESDQLQFIDRYVDQKIPIDYWWMDAGWYPCRGKWNNTGTWQVDTERFPRGLRAISDHARAANIKTLVWFEPERVAPDTWLDQQKPHWLLNSAPPPTPDPGSTPEPADVPWWRSPDIPEHRLLDLGNDQALQWLIDHTDQLIRAQGIDLYRQDFNIDPLPYWQANDSPDRRGITEIRYVQGYLMFWQTLRDRFPDMLIDSCASGGRRNDLETMRLAVPLHKTDYNYADLKTKQAFHHSLFHWIPFFGAPAIPPNQFDAYSLRSAYAPMTALAADVRRDDLDFAALRRFTAEWRRIAPYYYGDYYPLLPFDRTDHTWLAWQFHRPDSADGLIQAFRRADSPFDSAHLPLHALDPLAAYQFTNLDTPDQPTQHTGHDLIDQGLPLQMHQQPQAVILIYQQQTPTPH